MVTICDNCKEEIVGIEESADGIQDCFTLELKGGKKNFCRDCFATLSEWACSNEHQKKVKKMRKEFE